MVANTNPDTLQEAREVLRLQGTDPIPSIQLVANVNPKELRRCNFVKSTSSTATGTGAIFTTSTTKKTFLAGAQLSAAYDATADSTSTTISGSPKGGSSTNFLVLRKITLTADASTQSVTFNPPLELEKGSAVNLGKTFTVGTAAIAGTVWGYETD